MDTISKLTLAYVRSYLSECDTIESNEDQVVPTHTGFK